MKKTRRLISAITALGMTLSMSIGANVYSANYSVYKDTKRRVYILLITISEKPSTTYTEDKKKGGARCGPRAAALCTSERR